MRRQPLLALRHLCDMRLTVVSLLILAVLTIWGTLYQVSHGLFAARQRFFDSWLILVGGFVPFPGVRLVSVVFVVNLAAAALMRFPWRWRSAGIILIHAGVAVLLIGGAISSVLTQESFMTLAQGMESATSLSTSDWELVAMYPDGREVSRSFRQCRPGQQLELLEGKNVKVEKACRDCLILTDASNVAVDLVSARSWKRRDDAAIPGLILTISEGGLSKRVVVHGADTVHHPVEVGRQSTHLTLRPAKVGLPVSIRLIQFSVSYHPGTTIARQYASRVRMTGPDIDREAVISMNQPLRYGAYAFYQSGHGVASDGVPQSTLAVVRNPVRTAPYLASLLLCAGLCIHFTAASFACRKRLSPASGLASPQSPIFRACLIAALALASGSFFPGICENRHFCASSMSDVLVLEGGRIKPFDTYARNLLLRFSGKSRLGPMSAVDWLAAVIFAPEVADHDPIFLINDPQVPEALGIAAVKKRRYSFAQLCNGMDRLSEAAQKAWERDVSIRTRFDTEIIRMHRNVSDYMALVSTFSFVIPHEAFNLDDEVSRQMGLASGAGRVSYADLLSRFNTLKTSLRGVDADSTTNIDAKLFELAQTMYSMSQAIGNPHIHLIPSGKSDVADWYSPWGLINAYYSTALQRAELSALLAAREAYTRRDRAGFDRAIGLLKNEVRRSSQTWLPDPAIELLYNRVDPFGKAKIIYGMASLFSFVALAGFGRRLRRVACVMIIAGLIFHTAGLIVRILISCRPPVANLYETFVFVAWACAVMGMIIESVQRGALGAMVGSISGFLLLHVAGRYGAEGDTIGILAAVLASNFWLSTHIISISLGYAGCVAASAAGHVYVVRSLFGGGDLRSVDRALCGLLAFGFSFTIAGAVLGGMWADQSWGRFWGWDPKENGALLIILWCAAALHARRGGMIREFGTAVSAITAGVLVLFTWIGVNLLGVGLHSYGFSTAGAGFLIGATVLETMFLGGAGLLRISQIAKRKSADGS